MTVMMIAVFLCVLTGVKRVDAFVGTPLPQSPMVSTDLTTQLDGKYAFSPVVSSQTRVITTSINNCTIKLYEPSLNVPNMPADISKVYVMWPTAGSNGNMQAKFTYTNVGFDNLGRSIDVVTTVTTTNSNKYALVLPIGAVTTSNVIPGQMSAQAKLNFVLHGTNTPATVSGGHLTFGPINSAKIVSLNTDNFTKIYTRSDTIIQYAPGSGV